MTMPRPNFKLMAEHQVIEIERLRTLNAELVAALKKIDEALDESRWSGGGYTRSIIRAAIAKAEGNTQQEQGQ
jgi:hypothetical protein